MEEFEFREALARRLNRKIVWVGEAEDHILLGLKGDSDYLAVYYSREDWTKAVNLGTFDSQEAMSKFLTKTHRMLLKH